MNTDLTIICPIHIQRAEHGRKQIHSGPAPQRKERQAGSIPRVSRFMALAIKFDRLIREKQVADYAELARVGHVTRARMTQIMNLINLAPDIQEELLFLPRTIKGSDTVQLDDMKPIMKAVDWKKQRELWRSQMATDPKR